MLLRFVTRSFTTEDGIAFLGFCWSCSRRREAGSGFDIPFAFMDRVTVFLALLAFLSFYPFRSCGMEMCVSSRPLSFVSAVYALALSVRYPPLSKLAAGKAEKLVYVLFRVL